MNTYTGELKSLSEVEVLPKEERSKYVEIQRDLTTKEIYTKQIKLYSPCGCNSGKKFKFCCYKKN